MDKWKDIPGYEGIYQASSCGKIRSLRERHGPRKKPKELVQYRHHTYNYLNVCLMTNGKKKVCTVHRLVAMAFLGESDLTVDHVNGKKTDNRIENLEFVTRSENFKRYLNKKYGVPRMTDTGDEK